MALSKEQLNILNTKFFQDPDWHLVAEMLSEKVEKKRDVATIDLTQSAETIKAIVSGRQELITFVDEFINDVKVAVNINNNKPTTFK